MSENENIAQRLQRLEDREEIRALVARYAFLVDNRDLDGVAGLFADNGRFRSKDGVINATGKPAVIEQFRRRFAVLGHGAHYGHDHVIWFDDYSSRMPAMGLLSSHAELVRNGETMIAALRYEDEYVIENGRWVFADRLLSFLYYLRADEYAREFRGRLRVKAYEQPQDADFPEALQTWRDYHSKN